MWAMTRIPGNPITGRGGPISEMAIAIEVIQITYIVLTAIIIAKENEKSRLVRRKRLDRNYISTINAIFVFSG